MKINNFNTFSTNLKESISPLSENEIKILLRENISAYLDKKIDLQMLVKIAQGIRQYASFPLNGLKSDIDEIISLNFVKEMLSDIADELDNEKI